jgi:hypothetical protein
VQPDPDASLSGYSRSEYSIACVRDETLKRSSQSDITNGDGLQMNADVRGVCGVIRADILLFSVVREPDVRFQGAIRLPGCAPGFPGLTHLRHPRPPTHLCSKPLSRRMVISPPLPAAGLPAHLDA